MARLSPVGGRPPVVAEDHLDVEAPAHRRQARGKREGELRRLSLLEEDLADVG